MSCHCVLSNRMKKKKLSIHATLWMNTMDVKPKKTDTDGTYHRIPLMQSSEMVKLIYDERSQNSDGPWE